MHHPRSKSALFTRRVQADTGQELAMPAVNPRRERMEDPDRDRFISDDGRLFEPRTATLFRRKVAKPIEVPHRLVRSVTDSIEALLIEKATESASQTWGHVEQRWVIDVSPYIADYAPWMVRQGRDYSQLRVMVVLLAGGSSTYEPQVTVPYYASRERTIVLPILHLQPEDVESLPGPVTSDIWTAVQHELAHVFQEAWQGAEGYHRHPALPMDQPVGDDVYEAKAYGSEICSDYAEDLRQNPELTIEEFLHGNPWGSLISQFSPREHRRLLRDLAITYDRRTTPGNPGGSSAPPRVSHLRRAKTSGDPVRSVAQDGQQAGQVLARLFQRQARIPGTETTITLKVSPGTEHSLVPLLEDLRAIGDWGCSRDVVVEDFTDEGSKEREKHGDGRHGFDGDGSDSIIDIKVETGKPKPRRAHNYESLRDPGCGAFARCVREHPELDGDAFFDFCTDHNRADCDSGELDSIGAAEVQRLLAEFTARPKQATLFTRTAPKVARPIDVPPELSAEVVGRVEALLARAALTLGSPAAWEGWVASSQALLQVDALPLLRLHLPWVRAVLALPRFGLQVEVVPPADTGVVCSGKFIPTQAVILVTLEGLSYAEAHTGLLPGTFNQVARTVTHELAHLMQAAYRERGGGRLSRKPYTLDESKAYAAELSDAYASALEHAPGMPVEEFLTHVPDCDEIRQLLGTRGWRRVLTDLGYVLQWHQGSGDTPDNPLPVHASSRQPRGSRTGAHDVSDAALLTPRCPPTLFTRTALIQPTRGEGIGAPASNRRHLDEDFKDEVEAERDPDLIRHTRGVEASAAWRPGK